MGWNFYSKKNLDNNYVVILGKLSMKQTKIFWTIVIFLAIFVQGCATPQYETFYSYIPPKGAEGTACIFQCSMTESQCEQLAQMRLDNCQTARANRLQACEYRTQAAYDLCVNTYGPNYGCYKEWCSENECTSTSNCKAKYNSCYSTCGGISSSETRCVANCEVK